MLAGPVEEGSPLHQQTPRPGISSVEDGMLVGVWRSKWVVLNNYKTHYFNHRFACLKQGGPKERVERGQGRKGRLPKSVHLRHEDERKIGPRCIPGLRNRSVRELKREGVLVNTNSGTAVCGQWEPVVLQCDQVLCRKLLNRIKTDV